MLTMNVSFGCFDVYYNGFSNFWNIRLRSYRSSLADIFQDRYSLKFRKFHRKTLLRHIFYRTSSVAASGPTRDSNTGDFLWNLWIFWEHMFYRPSPIASGPTNACGWVAIFLLKVINARQCYLFVFDGTLFKKFGIKLYLTIATFTHSRYFLMYFHTYSRNIFKHTYSQVTFKRIYIPKVFSNSIAEPLYFGSIGLKF